MKKLIAILSLSVVLGFISQAFGQDWTNYPPPPTNSWWTNVPPPYPTNYPPVYTNLPPFTNFPPPFTNFPPGYTNFSHIYTNFPPVFTNLPPVFTNFPPVFTNLPPFTNFPPVCTNLPPGLPPRTNGVPSNVKAIIQQFQAQRATLIAELQSATDASQRAAILADLQALRLELQQELEGLAQTSENQILTTGSSYKNAHKGTESGGSGNNGHGGSPRP